jgi:hypothetical protein
VGWEVPCERSSIQELLVRILVKKKVVLRILIK